MAVKISNLMKKKEVRDRERRRRQHICDFYANKELEGYRRLLKALEESDNTIVNPAIRAGRIK